MIVFYNILSNEKDLIDIFSAIIPIILTALILLIGYFQWKTNANNYRANLFKERYEAYLELVGLDKYFLKNIAPEESGKEFFRNDISNEFEKKLWRIHKKSKFLFDKKIESFTSKLWDNYNFLRTHHFLRKELQEQDDNKEKVKNCMEFFSHFDAHLVVYDRYLKIETVGLLHWICKMYKKIRRAKDFHKKTIIFHRDGTSTEKKSEYNIEDI